MDLERLEKFKEVFTGDKNQNIEAFFKRFESWCRKHGHDDIYKTQNFAFCLDGAAYTCYDSLPQATKDNYPLLKDQLITYYAPTQLPMDEQFEKLTDLKLRKGDSVQSYFNTIMKKTEKLDMPEAQKIAIFKRGLPNYIRRYIKLEKPEGLLENLKKAKEAVLQHQLLPLK